jgi:hypothetical protein
VVLLLAMFSFAAGPPAGSWSIVASPNADATRQNELNGVTCISSSDCWAVGDYYTSANAYQTLIEHWDGNGWTIVPSQNSDPTQTNLLFNVACVSSSDCWAVGKHKTIVQAGGGTILIVDQTLTQHWDGTTWTIVTSPNSQPIENYLLDVACTSTSDCWAVGYSRDIVSGLYQTLIEHWDGTVWSLAVSPNTDQHNYLQSVTCTSTSDCWTAGASSDPSNGSDETLVQHWDGSAWSIVASPNNPTPAGSLGNSLSDLTCNSASDCWASGSSDPGPGFGWATLIEHWDGSVWTIVASPNTSPTRNNFLFGVTCASASDCWVVGRASNGAVEQTLTEHWDGNSWTIITSPDTSSTRPNLLARVACASGADCWAVGNYVTAGNVRQTLALHYTVSPVPIGVVSRKVHGSAGTFDIDLPLTGGPGIECRSGGATGDHQVVITFATSVTVTDATVTPGSGGTASIILAPGHQPPNEVVATLDNVSNAQTLTINLLGVNDETTIGEVHIPVAVLLGDVNTSKRTDSGDVTATRNKTISIPDQQTFRNDVDTSGRIDAGDVTVIRNVAVSTLPP